MTCKIAPAIEEMRSDSGVTIHIMYFVTQSSGTVESCL
jgi:hypothetical protein